MPVALAIVPKLEFDFEVMMYIAIFCFKSPKNCFKFVICCHNVSLLESAPIFIFYGSCRKKFFSRKVLRTLLGPFWNILQWGKLIKNQLTFCTILLASFPTEEIDKDLTQSYWLASFAICPCNEKQTQLDFYCGMPQASHGSCGVHYVMNEFSLKVNNMPLFYMNMQEKEYKVIGGKHVEEALYKNL